MRSMKNKTFAVWLTFFGGPIGLHRFYLKGFADPLGWLLPVPTALGWYGVQRALELGQDDPTSWVFIPLLGFTMAGCALNAIVYGLMPMAQWNSKFNQDAESSYGQTNWLTIFGLATFHELVPSVGFDFISVNFNRLNFNEIIVIVVFRQYKPIPNR